MNKKHYQLTITDSDGDSHSYYFHASMVWMVTNFVIVTMLKDGDFFGHTPQNTQSIAVDQMVTEPRNGIIEIELL